MFDAIKMLSEGRIGFTINEVMSGIHNFIDGPDRNVDYPLEFRVTWGNRNLLTRFLNPFDKMFMTAPMEGEVTVGGLVENAKCTGRLELRYFTEAKIRYIFDFEDKNGKKYNFIGEKINIKPWNLYWSHTTCYGTLKEADTGKEVSRSITYFRLVTIPAFLWSLKWA